ncbi:unnamed protein product [Closterium sp. NIES-53]
MGLRPYLCLSMCLLVVTASIRITTARPVNKDNKGGKEGPPDAGPCPLPKPKDAEPLGNLTASLLFSPVIYPPVFFPALSQSSPPFSHTLSLPRSHSSACPPLAEHPPPPSQPPISIPLRFRAAILAARLNGSNVVGATGDVNATGRICLAVFKLDGDYNVFYSVVTSTADDGEPFGATISIGAAGEGGDAAALLVQAGETTTWANLTRPPPPPPKGKKNKGTPPPPPPPKYTYASHGTWLTASTMATIGGQTLKALVDAMLANPDGYYASFATTGYDSGAARGQFQSDPLPPPPKDKQGGKDGGKKGGKDGGKNGGGKNGGDQFGTLVGVIAARVNGSNVDLQGDVNATGCVDLVVFLNATTYDYDIRYHVRVSLNDSGEPIGVVIKKGADVALTVLTSDATWTNRTLSDAERAKLGGKLTPKGRKGKQPPPPPPPLGYSYETSGTWLSATTLTADNGQTYKELADAMLAAPDTYSALIYTKTFEKGVASGAFGNVTKGDGEASSKLAVKIWFYRVARIIKHH